MTKTVSVVKAEKDIRQLDIVSVRGVHYISLQAVLDILHAESEVDSRDNVSGKRTTAESN